MNEKSSGIGEIVPSEIEKDTKPNFKDICPMDQPMSVDEAIGLLANFHNADRDRIIQIFFALYKSSLEDISKVEFKNSISGGYDFINIQIYDKEGRANVGGQLINPITGHATARVG